VSDSSRSAAFGKIISWATFFAPIAVGRFDALRLTCCEKLLNPIDDHNINNSRLNRWDRLRFSVVDLVKDPSRMDL